MLEAKIRNTTLGIHHERQLRVKLALLRHNMLHRIFRVCRIVSIDNLLHRGSVPAGKDRPECDGLVAVRTLFFAGIIPTGGK